MYTIIPKNSRSVKHYTLAPDEHQTSVDAVLSRFVACLSVGNETLARRHAGILAGHFARLATGDRKI